MANDIPGYLKIKKFIFDLIEKKMKEEKRKTVTKNEIVRMYVTAYCHRAYVPVEDARILNWAFYDDTYFCPGNGRSCFMKCVPGDDRFLERVSPGQYELIKP